MKCSLSFLFLADRSDARCALLFPTHFILFREPMLTGYFLFLKKSSVTVRDGCVGK